MNVLGSVKTIGIGCVAAAVMAPAALFAVAATVLDSDRDEATRLLRWAANSSVYACQSLGSAVGADICERGLSALEKSSRPHPVARQFLQRGRAYFE